MEHIMLPMGDTLLLVKYRQSSFPFSGLYCTNSHALIYLINYINYVYQKYLRLARRAKAEKIQHDECH